METANAARRRCATGCLFRRFCGLPLDMETPDHASIWPFRQTIDKLGLSAALLAEVNRQLDARGFVIRRGTLVDATFIAGAITAPYPGGRCQSARPWTRVSSQAHYKAHLAVDEGSGLVRQAEMTSANVHDSRLGEALIQGDEQGYFADRRTTARLCARRSSVAGWSMGSPGGSNTPAIRSRPWTGSVRSAVECDPAWKIDPLMEWAPGSGQRSGR